MDKVIASFSWMLIHSLWQGLGLAIITSAMLLLTKRSNAAHRYNIMLILFLAFIGICTGTFIWEWNSAATIVSPLADNIGARVSTLLFNKMNDVKELIKMVTGYFSANAPLIVLIWCIIFIFKNIKMIAGLAYIQNTRTKEVFEPSAFWINYVGSLSEKLHINKAVKLLESGYIKMPVVTGHFKPIILIPAGLLTGLPFDQVEAILLHELAHIRRNDYFINFLQNITENIFFFNPGLLWVSSLLREERENCCDDIAMAQTNNRRGFIEALVRFKEHDLYGSGYVTAFPGKKNYLLQRVRRILDHKNKTLGTGEKIFITISIFVLTIIITAATIAQMKDNTKTNAKPVNTTTRFIPPKSTGIHEAEIKREKPIRQQINEIVNKEMSDIIHNTKKNRARVAVNRTTAQPVPVVVSITKIQEALINKQKAHLDQLQAAKDEERVLQAQQKTMKDQKQALRNQVQARLYEEQEKEAQEQAMKEKADADASKMNIK